MTRTLEDALRWVAQGSSLTERAIASLSDEQMSEPSGLSGWSRLHLLAHVAANADALCNLVSWASTGIETPMYSSTTQRADDIEAGAKRPAYELRAWLTDSTRRLSEVMQQLDAVQWQRNVVTAQGRTVPATEIPWLRAREVMVHAVDFASGIAFEDMPQDFLIALISDIVAKRSGAADGPALIVRSDDGHAWECAGQGAPQTVTATGPQLAAYLAGRPSTALQAAPQLPRWL